MKEEKKENFLVRTLNKIKKISNGIDVIVQLVYIVYLIASLYLGKGNEIANYIFLGVSVLYLIYHLFTYRKYMEGDKTIHRKGFKKIIKFLKKLVNIAVIIFAILEEKNAGSFDLFQVGSAIIMIIGFITSLIFEFMVMSLKKKVARIKESVSEKIGKVKGLFAKKKEIEE